MSDRMKELNRKFRALAPATEASLREENHTLRQQLEQAEARVAELEAGYTKLCNSASLTRKILQDSATRNGVTDVVAHANWGHLDTREHEDRITKSDSRPWLLRKQAAAVEAFAEWVDPHWPKSQAIMIKDDARSHAFELRQQADEAERGEL